MCSVEDLRGFINERLTAVAVEIFSAVERTLSRHQEEVEARRRLLDIDGKSTTKLPTTGLPQQHICKEKEPRQLIKNPKRSTLDLVEPDPPQNIETQEEPESPQNEQQKETQPLQPERNPEKGCNTPGKEPFDLKQESDIIMVTITDDTGEPEPDDEQPHSQDSFVDESYPQAKYQHANPESTMTAELGPSKRQYFEHMANSPISEKRWKKGKGKKYLQCEICGKGYKLFFQLQRHRRTHTSEAPHSHETLWNSFNPQQGNPEFPSIKLHQVESSNSREERKQQDDYIIVTLTDDGDERSGSDSEQPLHHDSASTESQNQKTDSEPSPERGPENNMDNSPISKNQYKTGKGKKCLKCDICGKSYKRLFQLQKHHRTHTGGRQDSDETLGKIFSPKQAENSTLDQGEPEFNGVQDDREEPDPPALEQSPQEAETPELNRRQVESESQTINFDLVESNLPKVEGDQEGSCTDQEVEDLSPSQEEPDIMNVSVTVDISEGDQEGSCTGQEEEEEALSPKQEEPDIISLYLADDINEGDQEEGCAGREEEEDLSPTPEEPDIISLSLADDMSEGDQEGSCAGQEEEDLSPKQEEPDIMNVFLTDDISEGDQEGGCADQEEEDLSPKQEEPDIISVSVPDDIGEGDQEGGCTGQEEESLSPKQEELDIISVSVPDEFTKHSDPMLDNKLQLCHDISVAESQDERKDQHADLKPTETGELKPKRRNRTKSVDNSPRSGIDKKALTKCDICAKSFKRVFQMRIHRRSHTGERPYPCETCGKTFTHKHHLKSHKIIHSSEKPHFCDFCSKSFKHRKTLMSHKKIHTGVKPHSCGICGKSFVERNNLLVHKRSHTNEKPFFCEMCGKGYKYKNYLLVHMRFHTGEKPFFCSICQRKFTTSSAMHKHKSVHTDIKPHSCEICGKKFRANSTLLGHMKTHTGEKPYSCEVCGKRFRFNSNVAVHMKTHTEEKLPPPNVSRRNKSRRR